MIEVWLWGYAAVEVVYNLETPHLMKINLILDKDINYICPKLFNELLK